MRIAIVTAIIILTLEVIIIRPYRIPESIAAAVGAALMLLGGFVGLHEAWSLISGEWNLYGFFLGLMIVSALADQAGIFEMLALQAGRWAGGGLWSWRFSVGKRGFAVFARTKRRGNRIICLTPPRGTSIFLRGVSLP